MTLAIGTTRWAARLIVLTMAALLSTTGLPAHAMNKGELVEYLYENDAAESQATAERILHAVVDAVRAGLKQDGQVQLLGFGSTTGTQELQFRVECTHDTFGTSCYLPDGSGYHSDQNGNTSCLLVD
jgi:hypothetical protein